MDKPENNKRVFTRTPFHTNAELYNANHSISCTLLNISLKGVLVEVDITANPVEKQQHYTVCIKLRASDISITAEGTIVHIENNQVGIRFDTIDIESMIHLRKVLEYNSDSVEKIESELSFLKHQ